MNLVFRSRFFWWAPGGLNGEKLNVCARYIGGVVKPSLATFALTFATRSAVSPTQLVLPEGGKQGKGATEKGHTHHTRYGIQHARNSPLWKYGKECPTNMASRFLAGRPWKKRLEHLNRKVNSKVAGLFCVGLQEYQNYSLGNKFCGGLKCWNYSGSANKYCGGKWKYRNYNGGGNKLAIFVRRLGLGWVCVFVSGA